MPSTAGARRLHHNCEKNKRENHQIRARMVETATPFRRRRLWMHLHLCSRSSTSLITASGFAIFLPLMSDARTSPHDLANRVRAGFCERKRSITLVVSISRSGSAIGRGRRDFIGLMRQTSYPVKKQLCDARYSGSAERGIEQFLLQLSL